VAGQFASYLDPEQKRYIHLVDGGVSDNLGMTVVLERLGTMGGVEGYSQKMNWEIPDHIVVIIVNAEIEPLETLNLKSVSPGLAATMGLVSGAQIRRANFETLDLSQRTITTIGEKLNSAGRPVTTHLIEVSFDLDDSEDERHYLKHLPTSFKLSDEQVDRLISSGRKILRESPDFQAALEAIR
jgi:NTE family protein